MPTIVVRDSMEGTITHPSSSYYGIAAFASEAQAVTSQAPRVDFQSASVLRSRPPSFADSDPIISSSDGCGSGPSFFADSVRISSSSRGCGSAPDTSNTSRHLMSRSLAFASGPADTDRFVLPAPAQQPFSQQPLSFQCASTLPLPGGPSHVVDQRPVWKRVSGDMVVPSLPIRHAERSPIASSSSADMQVGIGPFMAAQSSAARVVFATVSAGSVASRTCAC
jgi:hypothetical protein